jgi:hypothetical protein
MNLKIGVSIVCAACLAACSPGGDGAAGNAQAPPAAAAPGEWTTLFDGTDLSRWNQIGDANWEIVDDTVRADSGMGGMLVSDVEYDDFDLSLEFWVNVEANSGVFIRCQDPEQIGADNCYEVNVFDTRPDQTYRTGGIVDFAPPAEIIYTGGRWNSYEVTADGTHLTVTLNGAQTVDVNDDTWASGPIALQYGGGTVIFRNVRIRPR